MSLLPTSIRPGRYLYPDASRVERSIYHRYVWEAFRPDGSVVGHAYAADEAALLLRKEGYGPTSLPAPKAGAA